MNPSEEPPLRFSVGEYFLEAPPSRIVLLAVSGLAFLISNVISINHAAKHYAHGEIDRKQKGKQFFPTVRMRILVQILWVQISSFTNFFCLLFPRMIALFTFVSHGYQAFALYSYVVLLGDIVGGRDHTLQISKMSKKSKIYSAFPFGCCFAPCMKPTSLTSSGLHWARIGVLQATIVQPTLSFLTIFFQMNGIYTLDDYAANNAYLYILVLTMGSTLLSMYFVGVIQNSIGNLIPNLSLKFLLVQTLVPLFVTQNFIISLVYNQVDTFKEDPTFPKFLAPPLYNSFLICIECIPLAILCFYAYPLNEDLYLKKLVSVAVQTEEGGNTSDDEIMVKERYSESEGEIPENVSLFQVGN